MSLSPISLAFKKCRNEKRPALLTYTVAGDNNKKKSLEILKSISENADLLELGFPHSTPIADGGQIQTSTYRAIKNGSLVGPWEFYYENGQLEIRGVCTGGGGGGRDRKSVV